MAFKPSAISKSLCYLLALTNASLIIGCGSSGQSSDKAETSQSATAAAVSGCAPGFELELPGAEVVSVSDFQKQPKRLELVEAFVYSSDSTSSSADASEFKSLTHITRTTQPATLCFEKSGEPLSQFTAIIPSQISTGIRMVTVEGNLVLSIDAPQSEISATSITQNRTQSYYNRLGWFMPSDEHFENATNYYTVYKINDSTYEIRTAQIIDARSGATPGAATLQMKRMVYKVVH